MIIFVFGELASFSVASPPFQRDDDAEHEKHRLSPWWVKTDRNLQRPPANGNASIG